MPRDENGDKWACEPCIRGHRSSKCEHFERLMIRVRKPGRPLSQCPHPPGECNCDYEKVMMVRINRRNGTGNAAGCNCVAKYYVDKQGRRRAVGPNGQPLPIPYVPTNGEDAEMEDEFDFNAPMQPPANSAPPPTGNEQAPAPFVFGEEQVVHQQPFQQEIPPYQPMQLVQEPPSSAPPAAVVQPPFQDYQFAQPQPLVIQSQDKFRQLQTVTVQSQDSFKQVQPATVQSQEQTPQEQQLPTPPEAQQEGFGFSAGASGATSTAGPATNGQPSVSPSNTKRYKIPSKEVLGYCPPIKPGGYVPPSQSLHRSEEETHALRVKIEEDKTQPNDNSGATCCTSSTNDNGTGEPGLKKAEGNPQVFEHFHDLAKHPQFQSEAALEHLQSRAAHGRYTGDTCKCGPGCTCFGCLAHPFNAGTQNRMKNLQALMLEESQETPSPTNTQKNPLEQPQEQAAGFHMVGGLESALAPAPLGFELAAPPQLPHGVMEQGNFSMSTTDNETFIYYWPQDNQAAADTAMFGPALYPSGEYACVDPAMMETNALDNGLSNEFFGEFINDIGDFTGPEQYTDDNEALAQSRGAHADTQIS